MWLLFSCSLYFQVKNNISLFIEQKKTFWQWGNWSQGKTFLSFFLLFTMPNSSLCLCPENLIVICPLKRIKLSFKKVWPKFYIGKERFPEIFIFSEMFPVLLILNILIIVLDYSKVGYIVPGPTSLHTAQEMVKPIDPVLPYS